MEEVEGGGGSNSLFRDSVMCNHLKSDDDGSHIVATLTYSLKRGCWI